MSALESLECPVCGSLYDPRVPQTICAACVSPLLCQYDLAALKRELDRDAFAARPRGIWRWHEMLPVLDPSHQMTLGEGDTPLIKADRLAGALGLRHLYIKDEGRNPTGTFKARGLCMAVAKALELGLRELWMPTAGNAGSALAAYAARAGIQAYVFMPADAPEIYQREVMAYGARLERLPGFLDQVGERAEKQAREQGWFGVATFKEPYRVEGKKTMGLELAEAFKWRLPEVILYPTGGGTGLVGMWKAFRELEALGWLEGPLPKLVAVQPEGCAPVVRALEKGHERISLWRRPRTAAHGLRVPKVFADRLVLKAVRESTGRGVVVSEVEIQEARTELGQVEGLSACLEGAATWAGLKRLVKEGWLPAEARIVLFNTGTGLKQAIGRN